MVQKILYVYRFASLVYHKGFFSNDILKNYILLNISLDYQSLKKKIDFLICFYYKAFYFTVTLQTNFFLPEITVILAFPFFKALILPFL